LVALIPDFQTPELPGNYFRQIIPLPENLSAGGRQSVQPPTLAQVVSRQARKGWGPSPRLTILPHTGYPVGGGSIWAIDNFARSFADLAGVPVFSQLECSRLDILFATSEALPFAKTGGLADVSGTLPIEVSRLGHNVTVFMPAYRQAVQGNQVIEPTGIRFSVSIGTKNVTGELLKSHLPGSDVQVYLVRQDDYFDRPSLYQEDGKDYDDNCERFTFFCRAVMESIRKLELNVDVLHANDWQTGLLPALLKIEYGHLPGYNDIASLFTIHNLAYQGQFWHWDMLLTGIDWKYFNWQQMEFFGNLNLMKTGIVFSDSINTVSPQYAEEIQSAELGCGLEGILRHRSDVVSGILNGVDYNEWSPEVDSHLDCNYSVDDWKQGKRQCTTAIRQEMGLPNDESAPLAGFVGRLDTQKGLDLIAESIRPLLSRTNMQWAILGTGDPRYHTLLSKLAAEHPQRIAVKLEFSNRLAHRIEAGAEMFLMPSRYEPCGLNQLYSLKYGTVPVVHTTGGLANTITDASPDNLAAGTANGFRFDQFNAQALEEALIRAYEAYRQPNVWDAIVSTGMRQDWSWGRSAVDYLNLYQATVNRHRQGVLS